MCFFGGGSDGPGPNAPDVGLRIGQRAVSLAQAQAAGDEDGPLSGTITKYQAQQNALAQRLMIPPAPVAPGVFALQIPVQYQKRS